MDAACRGNGLNAVISLAGIEGLNLSIFARIGCVNLLMQS